ncbi:hypothetical protein GGTG_11101 [Gaeumannomyces tritici R3-111a-1]|uniref:Uncharacterized protein n=1 Tax=Gaeumannomyces tritici (strain R3-111a-1) TaxID=644352 RepID=J3PC78_GAET3|nr:hypothetical protein GGTG_11101 [Gaeumannomyces tritici R3-111a-1]EJT71848.1 hypothetical protein GGTG_11101 [Gaeumannomyces tritici R3-111a-1]
MQHARPTPPDLAPPDNHMRSGAAAQTVEACGSVFLWLCGDECGSSLPPGWRAHADANPPAEGMGMVDELRNWEPQQKHRPARETFARAAPFRLLARSAALVQTTMLGAGAPLPSSLLNLANVERPRATSPAPRTPASAVSDTS